MKKTLSKAKNGKMVRTSVVDPEGNKIKQKTNTRTGVTKTVVKYSDPTSSGKRREVTREFSPKNLAVYKKNPKALEEDYGNKFKKGGAKKPLAKAQKGKAVNTYTPFQNYMKTPGAMASDTTQSFTGSRDGSNPVLDKAYYDTYYAGQENKRRTGSDKVKYDAEGKRVHKTGGMVNSNAKVSSLKSAGSKGVKSGVNPKASASKKATGHSGGTSTAPKTALPKAQLGRFIKIVGKGAKAAKAAKAIDAAADAAKTVKRANAAAEAVKAAKKTSGMKSFSDDISAAFERMERKALKEKLIAADKASKKKKGGAVIRKK